MSVLIQRVDYQNPQHAQALISLLEMYAQDPMGGHAPLAESVKQTLPAQLAAFPTAMSWLAWIGGEPVGLVNAFRGFSTFRGRELLNIHDIAVHPAYRGQGIARQLLAAVEVAARQLDCCKLTLEVLSGNQAAQQLYRHFGFQAYQLDEAAGTALFWQKTL